MVAAALAALSAVTLSLQYHALGVRMGRASPAAPPSPTGELDDAAPLSSSASAAAATTFALLRRAAVRFRESLPGGAGGASAGTLECERFGAADGAFLCVAAGGAPSWPSLHGVCAATAASSPLVDSAFVMAAHAWTGLRVAAFAGLLPPGATSGFPINFTLLPWDALPALGGGGDEPGPPALDESDPGALGSERWASAQAALTMRSDLLLTRALPRELCGLKTAKRGTCFFRHIENFTICRMMPRCGYMWQKCFQI